MSPLSLYNQRSVIYRRSSFQDMFLASSLTFAQQIIKETKTPSNIESSGTLRASIESPPSSEKTIASMAPSALPYMSATASSDSSLTSSEERSSPGDSPKKANKTSFHSTCSVVLIPERKEYYQAGLAKTLWWTAPDYENFTVEAKKEIHKYMGENQLSGNEGTKKAIQELYQSVRGEKCP